MANEKVFLLPVVIDDTRDAEARVPGNFASCSGRDYPGRDLGGVCAARTAVARRFSPAMDFLRGNPEFEAYVAAAAKDPKRAPRAKWAAAGESAASSQN